MRIIAGALRGRRLTEVAANAPLRPTSDSLRETLFNVLGPTLTDANVLDGFSGTGAIGLEALSRGARHATFIENDKRSLAVLRENIRLCGMESSSTVIRDTFARASASLVASPATLFDLVVLDPPYDVDALETLVSAATSLCDARGRVVLEHSRRCPSPEAIPGWTRVRVLTAGDSALSFYRAEPRTHGA